MSIFDRTVLLLATILLILVANTQLTGRPINAAATRDESNRTELISRSIVGDPANNESQAIALSADARYVLFSSSATDLVANDNNGMSDMFVRDRNTDSTVRVSVATDGTEADESSFEGAMSANGRFVVFSTDATNLGDNSTEFQSKIYLHDRDADENGVFDEAGGRTTTLVSRDADGQPLDDDSYNPTISADGSTIAFGSEARFDSGDANFDFDVFVRNRVSGETVLVSRSADGDVGNGDSAEIGMGISLSANGRFVAFASNASNLVENDTNNCSFRSCEDVFVHDRDSNETGVFDENGGTSIERVSVSSNGVEGNADSADPHISAEGSFVTFTSSASNLVLNDMAQCFGSNCRDVFLHNRSTGETIRISELAGQAPQEGSQSTGARMAANGSTVVFASNNNSQFDGDCSGITCIYRWTRATGTIERVSIATDGGVPSTYATGPAVSALGTSIIYHSQASNLVTGDNNGQTDVFLYSVAGSGGDSAEFDIESRVNVDGINIVPWETGNDLIVPVLLSTSSNEAVTVDVLVTAPNGSVTRYPLTFPPNTSRQTLTWTPPAVAADAVASYRFSFAGARNATGFDAALFSTILCEGCEACHMCKVGSTLDGERDCIIADRRVLIPNLSTLYTLRDDVMATTPVGRHLTRLYYAHTSEVLRLTASDLAMTWQMYDGMTAWQPALAALANGEGDGVMISQTMVDHVETVLDALEAAGSAELRAVIQAERSSIDLQSFVGSSMDEAWSVLNERTIAETYLPMVQR